MLDQLRHNDKDWELYLVTSDWCEERGDMEAAEGLRWQARNRKRPASYPMASTWFNGSFMGGSNDPESDLPGEVFDKLPSLRAPYVVMHDYESFEDACRGLWRAMRCSSL